MVTGLMQGKEACDYGRHAILNGFVFTGYCCNSLLRITWMIVMTIGLSQPADCHGLYVRFLTHRDQSVAV